MTADFDISSDFTKTLKYTLNRITTVVSYLLLCLLVKEFVRIVNFWRSCWQQKNVDFVYFCSVEVCYATAEILYYENNGTKVGVVIFLCCRLGVGVIVVVRRFFGLK